MNATVVLKVDVYLLIYITHVALSCVTCIASRAQILTQIQDRDDQWYSA